MDSSENNDLKDLKSFFSNRSKEIKEEKNQTLSIIGAHLEKIDVSNLSETEKQQNKKDLTHVGGFLSSYDDSISIEEALRKSPDFLIRKNKKVIGLALTDLSSCTDLKNTLLAAITQQETILNAYKSSSNASEFWLLAVLDDLDAIDHSIKEDLFTTAFDKIVVYDFSRSEIIELKKQ